MKKRKEILVDLPYDILKDILICLARSSHGAEHIATLISVCKALQQFVEDVDVLEAVNFNNVLVFDHWEWFQLREGLTFRCARSGQAQAQFILAKIILASAPQVLILKTEPIDKKHESSSKDGNRSEKAARAFNFMKNFLGNKTGPNFIGHHFDFVNFFLSGAKYSEFIEMKPYIYNYMRYFIGWMEHVDEDFIDSQLCEFERCYCFEEKLISLMLKLPSIRTLCLSVAMKCRLLGSKKELLGSLIALIAEETEEVCDGYFTAMVAEIEMKLKRMRGIIAVFESIRWQNRVQVTEESEEVCYAYLIKVVSELDLNINKARDTKAFLECYRLKHRVQDELSYDALYNEVMHRLKLLMSTTNTLERAKALAVSMQEKRASIMSTFHQLYLKSKLGNY